MIGRVVVGACVVGLAVGVWVGIAYAAGVIG